MGSVVVAAAKDQISADLSGDAVILHLGKGFYYSLDEVGSHIWALLQKPGKVSEILNSLLERYDVDPERCWQDLLGLLEQLRAENLIEIKSEETP